MRMTLWQAIFVTLVTFVLACSAHALPVRVPKDIALWNVQPALISTGRRVPNLSLCYESAQHRLGHIDCEACREEQTEEMSTSELLLLPLPRAAEKWLQIKQIYIQARTLADYRQYFSAVCQFTGDVVVRDLNIEAIRGYQRWRLGQGVGSVRINHEVSVLGQMLKDAGTWHAIKPYYKPLPMSKEPTGKAITKEESKRLFIAAEGNRRWEVALYAGVLSVNTTAGPGEIRHLQLRDINLQERTLYIRRAVKNRYRVRTLPLNDAALRAVSRLLDRAYRKGAHLPEHYLLPHRAQKRGMEYDPTKPQGHWHKAWDKLRKAADLPTLRLYDLRHTAITWMLCDPNVPTQVVVEIAGWVDPRMIERYSHQQIEAKRAALKTLESSLESKRPAARVPEFTFLISPLWISGK